MLNDRAVKIKNNIEKINEDISKAADGAGRKSSAVRLMAVSKTKPIEDLLAAYEAGHRLFGENRIQEIIEKKPLLPYDLELHMIGHLQSNKAKAAAENVDCVQSIDKLNTARELNKKAVSTGRKIDYLIEINTSGEYSKDGYDSFKSVQSDIEQYLELEMLNLRGFMTIAPFTDDTAAIRKSFRTLFEYYEKIKTELKLDSFDTLSMGMSSDFNIAIEEGSTLIRIGTAIFGGR